MSFKCWKIMTNKAYYHYLNVAICIQILIGCPYMVNYERVFYSYFNWHIKQRVHTPFPSCPSYSGTLVSA